jgi:hypothetical protein
VLELPVDHPRGPRQTFRGTTYRLRLAPELTAALKALGRRHDATLFMTLVAGLQVLLHRYCRQDAYSSDPHRRTPARDQG